MTDPVDLVAPERVRCNESVHSKKRALESAAALLAPALPRMSRIDVFNALNSRERLGSTALGHGVALPHARVALTKQPIGACITLAEPIDFEAPDHEPVDILYVLLVPEDCRDDHLEILSALARLFDDAEVRRRLREAEDADGIIEHLRMHGWHAAGGAGR